jgi:hypothetical protein
MELIRMQRGMIALLAVLALAGCDSGDNGPTLISVGGPSSVGGLSPVGGASPGFLAKVTDGQFLSGDRSFFIFTNTKNGRLYAGALNVVGGRATINCLDQSWALQPDYGGADGGPTSGYIENNKFTMSGTWSHRRRESCRDRPPEPFPRMASA